MQTDFDMRVLSLSMQETVFFYTFLLSLQIFTVRKE